MKFSRLSTEDGLSIDSVTCIIQDKTGFIWIGTIYGLNRYDGYNFKIYRHQPTNENSLSENWIKVLSADRYGFIWIGTQGGLNRLDPDSDTFKRFYYNPKDLSSLKGGHISAIHEDSKGVLWIGTTQALNKYDRENDTFTHYLINPGSTHPPHSLTNKIPCQLIYEDRSGRLWVGTGSDIYEFDQEKETFVSIREMHDILQPFGTLKFTTFHRDKQGNFFIGTFGEGIIKFKPGDKSVTRFKHDPLDSHSISDNEIRSIYETRSGELWFGTSTGGLNRYDSQNHRFVRYIFEANRERVSGNVITAIFEDRYGVLWLGLYGKGITKIIRTKKIFKSYGRVPNSPNTLSGSSVLAIYEDRQGILWIGTEIGLNRYEQAVNRFVHYKHDPSKPGTINNDCVRSIIEDKFGRLWFGTHGGLDRFDRKTETFIHYPQDPGNPTNLSNQPIVKKLYKDSDGTLWAGTPRGLDRFDYDKNCFTRFSHDPKNPGSLSHPYVYTILEDHEGTLWIGTRGGGLNRFDKETSHFVHYRSNPKNPTSLSSPVVISLLEDKTGYLWVGTKEGLNRLDRKTGLFTRFYEKDGLPNNIIYGILEDEKGNLWLSTNRGLCKFNPRLGPLKNYFSEHGLQDNEFNGDVCFKSKSGQFFFGGIRGFTAFYPGEIESKTVNSNIVLLSLRLIGEKEKTISPPSDMKSMVLSYKERILAVEFAVLDFRAPKKNQYACQLEGIESDWNYIGNRNFAIYTNLEPGKYMLKVKGADSENTWTKKEISLRIHIPPPFWQTTWFRILLSLLVIFLVSFLVKLRLNRVETQKKRLEKLVAERTKELQNEREVAITANRSKGEFLARMSHEIRTPLNSVIGFTEMLLDTDLNQQQTDFVRTINQSGEVLLTLINDILDFSRFEAGQLALEHIDFDPEDSAFTVCELVLPRIADKPVEILCRIHDNVPPYVKGDPGRYSQVLINLVGNAAKFTEKGIIELSLDAAEEQDDNIILHTSVRDTGVGIPESKLDAVFEVFQQADGSVTRKYGGSGLGLSISKQIAKRMGGDLTVESEPGKGSIFHFTARMGKAGNKSQEAIIPGGLEGRKILIVDDNKNNLDILAHVLGKAGVRVTALEGGQEAMIVLRESLDAGDPFELCIIDIRMPGISGYDLCEQIRASQPEISKLPLLAFSSSIGKEAKKTRDAGFDAFLPKPVRRQKLLETIRQFLDETTITEDEPEPAPAASPGRSIRILLVEDNPINRKLAVFMLAKAGYRVEIAVDGKEAVEKYTAAPDIFDLILMDIQMPEMDGREATREIRKFEREEGRGHGAAPSNPATRNSQPATRHIPIIAMTAQSMKGDREACLEAGMNDYISKPIKSEVVFQMVEKWIMKL